MRQPNFSFFSTGSAASLAVVVALGLSTMTTGCSQEKPRLERGEVSRHETRSPQILPTTFEEFAEQLAQDFAQDLTQIKSEQGIEQRVTIAFGDIQNRTGIVSSSEFEIIRNSMRARLIQSPFIRREARFVESRARMNALIRTETGQMDEVDRIELANSWVLNMDVLRAGRDRMNLYAVYARLVDFRTGEIVFEREYQSKQVQQR